MRRVALVLALCCVSPGAHAQERFSVRVAGASKGEIPRRSTCAGEGESPRVAWSGTPAGTRSMALIVDDPDAPRGTFTHWLLYDIPPDAGAIEAGRPKERELARGAKQGENDYGRVGFGPPCPPPGRAHRYRFTLYALDGDVHLAPGADRQALERAIRGHVLAESSVTLRFARSTE